MKRNVDRFASVECRELCVGDVVRIHARNRRVSVPAVILAFPGERDLRHCVTVRDLSTGKQRTISQFWAVSR